MKKGFTLVELIIVMIILAALAGAVIPAFSANKAAAQNARVRADLEAIKSAMYVYRADVGAFPLTMLALTDTTAANTLAGFAGPYLDVGTPPDPCGVSYTYTIGPPRTVQRAATSSCPAWTVTVNQSAQL